MPLRMVEVKRGGSTIGFKAVDPGGKQAATFLVGRSVNGRRIKSLEDARNRARAFVQRVNLEERRAAGRSAPPRPRGG